MTIERGYMGFVLKLSMEANLAHAALDFLVQLLALVVVTNGCIVVTLDEIGKCGIILKYHQAMFIKYTIGM